jgi:hypothetical protein
VRARRRFRSVRHALGPAHNANSVVALADLYARAERLCAQLDAATGISDRVGFAYFSTDGTAREGADEVYVVGVRPGDSCSAVYPENQPELGILSRR